VRGAVWAEGLMDVYRIGDLWFCSDCATASHLVLFAGAQGPFPEGGGIAMRARDDHPRYCASCGVFLRNPLGALGLAYVRETVALYKDRHPDVVEWAEFYRDALSRD
jgi:hypothetical protein